MFCRLSHLFSLVLVLSVGISITCGQSRLTEEFFGDGDSFDLEYSSVMFTPTSSGTSYTYSLQTTEQLPVDPAGGINLGLGDDMPVKVSLLGNQVIIFGQSFSTFWVSPNGYITFGQGDADASQTLEEHFEILRISALYTDLTAAWAGAVTSRQMYDRVAVTWQAVPEYSYAAENTFQIEMFFDGRIRLSWLQINADECIVGLSNGGGLPDGFVETDFTGVSQQASEPSPANGALRIATWAALSWRAGDTAASHDVYVGTSYSSVDKGVEGTFKGNQIGTGVIVGLAGFPYPKGLVLGTTYYWRIDEVEADDTVHKGDVWSFSAEEYVPILDKQQTLDYDNTSYPYVTELVLDTPADLTAGGTAWNLTLRFRGDSKANSAEPIYVAIEDSAGATATVVYPDPAATLIADWVDWRIPLTEFAGIDLTKAVSAYIGIGDGEPGGGSGSAEIAYFRAEAGGDNRGQLAVFVKAEDGSGIAGATVIMEQEGSGTDYMEAKTSDLGDCAFAPLIKEKYTVTVMRTGYVTQVEHGFSIAEKYGNFVIFALVRDLPGGNDSCQKAIELSGNVTDLAYDTSKATFDGIEGDDRCIDTPNLWYRYTATETGNVTVTLEGDNYSVDPKLAIYDGTDCPPTMDDLIGCNDDFDVDSMGWASQITFWAIEGKEYLIEVASRVADEAGPGRMTIRAH